MMRFVNFLFAFLFLALVTFADTVIIVLDTSLSMNRKVIDNQRLFDVAIKSLSNAVYSLKRGDILYFADFNEDVYIRPPIKIEGEHSKEVIYKIISGTQPYGRWTFTYRMMQKVSELIEKEKIDPKNSRVIIISDGIDDPPIKKKEYLLELDKISSLFDPQQLIYYISLEKLMQKKSKDSMIGKKLKEGVTQIKILEATTPEEAKQVISETVKGEYGLLNIPLIMVLFLVVIVIILLAIVGYNYTLSNVIAKRLSPSVVVFSSSKHKKTVELNNIKKNKVTIGGKNVDIIIPEFGYHGIITIKRNLKGYRIFFSLPKNLPVKNGKYLLSGESFSVANYIITAE